MRNRRRSLVAAAKNKPSIYRSHSYNQMTNDQLLLRILDLHVCIFHEIWVCKFKSNIHTCTCAHMIAHVQKNTNGFWKNTYLNANITQNWWLLRPKILNSAGNAKLWLNFGAARWPFVLHTDADPNWWPGDSNHVTLSWDYGHHYIIWSKQHVHYHASSILWYHCSSNDFYRQVPGATMPPCHGTNEGWKWNSHLMCMWLKARGYKHRQLHGKQW